MKKKIVAALVSLALIMGSLTGCNKVNQLHERLIVQGVGVDTLGENFEITMHVFDDINTGVDEAEKTEILTGSGGSVLDAFTNISLKTGRSPLYSQNLVLIIGEEAARSGIENIIDFFLRYYEARPSVSVFVAQGSAKDIMTSKYNDQMITAMKISALASSGEVNAQFLKSNLVDVTNSVCGNLTDPVAMSLKLEKTDNGNRVLADSTAVFSGDRLSDFLDSAQTRGLLILSSKVKGGTFSLNTGDGIRATLMFDKTKTHLDMSIEGGTPKITANVQAVMDLYALDGNIMNKYSMDYLSELEKGAAEQIRQDCLNAINRAIFELDCDVFNFGKLMRLHQPDYFRSVENDWHSAMKDITYEVNADVSINKLGQEIKPR